MPQCGPWWGSSMGMILVTTTHVTAAAVNQSRQERHTSHTTCDETRQRTSSSQHVENWLRRLALSKPLQTIYCGLARRAESTDHGAGGRRRRATTGEWRVSSVSKGKGRLKKPSIVLKKRSRSLSRGSSRFFCLFCSLPEAGEGGGVISNKTGSMP
jgi:hypothetical protein